MRNSPDCEAEWEKAGKIHHTLTASDNLHRKHGDAYYIKSYVYRAPWEQVG